MGLLERAALETAKKLAEKEEQRTDVVGIVRASKLFPVVGIVVILVGIGAGVLGWKQGEFLFYVLAVALAVMGILLLVYGQNFRIEYDRTGIVVSGFLGREKRYRLDEIQRIVLKTDGFVVHMTSGKIRVEKDFFLGTTDFLHFLREYQKERRE